MSGLTRFAVLSLEYPQDIHPVGSLVHPAIMNWKSIISIIALLGIGFIAGFFTNRHLTVKKANKIAALRKVKGLENRLYETLELAPEQKEQLAPIIKKHLEVLAQLNKTHQEKRVATINELKEAIVPSLNEVQKRRLDKFSKRLKRFQRGRKKNKTSGKRNRNLSD